MIELNLAAPLGPLSRGAVKPVFQELNLRLIFNLRPEFSEVCFKSALQVTYSKPRCITARRIGRTPPTNVLILPPATCVATLMNQVDSSNEGAAFSENTVELEKVVNLPVVSKLRKGGQFAGESDVLRLLISGAPGLSFRQILFVPVSKENKKNNDDG